MIHYPPLTHHETLYRMFVQGTESANSPVLSFFIWPIRVMVLTLSYSLEIFLNRSPGERYYRFLNFFLGSLLMFFVYRGIIFYPQVREAGAGFFDTIGAILLIDPLELSVPVELPFSWVILVPLITFTFGVLQHVFRRYNRIMVSANPIHSQSHGKSRFFGWVRKFIKDEYQHQVFTAFAEPILVISIALFLSGDDVLSEDWIYLPDYLIFAALCLLFRRGISLSYERTQRLNLYDAQLQNIPTLKAYNQKSGMFNQEHSARRA